MSSTVLNRVNDVEPSLVLFGRDPAGKPRASWFDAGSIDFATSAAELMHMKILRIITEEQRALPPSSWSCQATFVTGPSFGASASTRSNFSTERVKLASCRLKHEWAHNGSREYILRRRRVLLVSASS